MFQDCKDRRCLTGGGSPPPPLLVEGRHIQREREREREKEKERRRERDIPARADASCFTTLGCIASEVASKAALASSGREAMAIEATAFKVRRPSRLVEGKQLRANS